MPRWTLLVPLLACLALPAQGQAHDFALGSLQIDHPWARASIGAAKAGAAYLMISNVGAAPDRLIAVETPAARRAALHTHMMDEGVMRMRPVEAVEVAPGEPAVLQPGALHIMLIGLTQPLAEGGSFPLTLTFEKAGAIEIEVKIEGATSKGPHPDGTAPAMEHDHSS